MTSRKRHFLLIFRLLLQLRGQPREALLQPGPDDGLGRLDVPPEAAEKCPEFEDLRKFFDANGPGSVLLVGQDENRDLRFLDREGSPDLQRPRQVVPELWQPVSVGRVDDEDDGVVFDHASDLQVSAKGFEPGADS